MTNLRSLHKRLTVAVAAMRSSLFVWSGLLNLGFNVQQDIEKLELNIKLFEHCARRISENDFTEEDVDLLTETLNTEMDGPPELEDLLERNGTARTRIDNAANLRRSVWSWLESSG